MTNTKILTMLSIISNETNDQRIEFELKNVINEVKNFINGNSNYCTLLMDVNYQQVNIH